MVIIGGKIDMMHMWVVQMGLVQCHLGVVETYHLGIVENKGYSLDTQLYVTCNLHF